VPADGFCEWRRIDAKTKQPFAFRLKDGAPSRSHASGTAWKDPTGEWL